jgi:parallel beta-helix repeat protein
VNLNCLNFSITGPAAYPSTAIYSNQANTSVSNCTINDFWKGIHFENVSGGSVIKNDVRSDVTQAFGIHLSGGTGNTLQDNTAITRPSYGGAAINLEGSSNNTLLNNYAESDKWIGITLWDLGGIGANNNVLTGNTGIGGADGIIVWRSHNNRLVSNTGTGTGNPGRGIYLVASNSNTLDSNICSATASATYIGVAGCDLIWSSNNYLANNQIQSNGGASLSIYGDGTNGASSGNIMADNTLSGPNIQAYIYGNAAGGNTFVRNHFTETAGIYVRDESSGNIWDTGEGSRVRQGNYWPNVLSGSVEVIDSKPGNGWGNCGTGFPYAQATSQGKFFGPGADNAPATTNIGNCGGQNKLETIKSQKKK